MFEEQRLDLINSYLAKLTKPEIILKLLALDHKNEGIKTKKVVKKQVKVSYFRTAVLHQFSYHLALTKKCHLSVALHTGLFLFTRNAFHSLRLVFV